MFKTWIAGVLLAVVGVVSVDAHADSSSGKSPGIAGRVAVTLPSVEHSPVGAATATLLGGEAATTSGSPPANPPNASPIAQREQQRQGFVGFTGRDAWPRGEVALTFDDGPHLTHTPKVLNLLKSHQLQATFFVIGQNINRYTFRLIQRMVQEGHQIGSHSYNHDVMMAHREGRTVVDYIRGEHEVTQILVNLAIGAVDADDFEQMYKEVFQAKPSALLSNEALANRTSEFLSRYRSLLVRRGMVDGRDPYPILFTRPPGGGPYMGQELGPRQRYDLALRQLGWLNVLWHGGCWDPDPIKRKDYDFVLESLLAQWKRGGIIIIHDYVRYDALANAIGRLASDPRTTTVLLDAAVTRKYGASASVLVAELRNGASAAELPAPTAIAAKSKPASSERQLAKSSHRAHPGQS